jgi:uncharacterized protein YjbJ (UPF0337 family)
LDHPLAAGYPDPDSVVVVSCSRLHLTRFVRQVVRRFFGPIIEKENTMNWDRVEGNWKQFKGKVKEKWGDLTDDDLNVIDGKKDQLAGKLQERYGYGKDKAQQEVDEFCNMC